MPPNEMRVLYVNHTSLVSGAEHSLLVLLRSLPAHVVPMVACPPGDMADAVSELGIPVSAIRGTELSGRIDLRHTTRGLIDVLAAAAELVAVSRRQRCDVIHANTLRAGLMSAALNRRRRAKLVVHVRDSVPPGRAPRALLRYLGREAAAFVPTSRFLADGLPRGPIVDAVANAVEPDRFDPARIDRDGARRRLDLAPDDQVLAVVGQISPHKGQAEAIETLRLVRREHRAAKLLVVGSAKFTGAATRYNNRSYEAELTGLVRRCGLQSAVRFLGERRDIPEILRAVDVQLVPSWYEPFGRVALEGMIMGIPVVATSVGGTKEVVLDGEDGLLLAPRRPADWARTVNGLLADPGRRTAMGEHGRQRALSHFGPAAHARAIVSTYERVLASAR